MRWAEKIVADRQNGKIVVGLVVVGWAWTGWWTTSS
jgi:hypothetical protein